MELLLWLLSTILTLSTLPHIAACLNLTGKHGRVASILNESNFTLMSCIVCFSVKGLFLSETMSRNVFSIGVND